LLAHAGSLRTANAVGEIATCRYRGTAAATACLPCRSETAPDWAKVV
jgi:hypothetical protein